MVEHAETGSEAPDAIAALIRTGAHREALLECTRQHGSALGRLCMALLGTQAEAEEAVQETLVAAWTGFGQFRGDGSLRAWLFGIARRVCARRFESRVRAEAGLTAARETDPLGSSTEEWVGRRERAARVRRALEELKPSERDVLVLRYEAGLSYREIGEACGIEDAAARKRASRALVQLRALLAGEVAE